MTEYQAFEKSKKIILRFHPNTDSFYLHHSVLEGDDWNIAIGYLDNGYHWISDVFIPKIGGCLLKSSQSLELSEHPDFDKDMLYTSIPTVISRGY